MFWQRVFIEGVKSTGQHWIFDPTCRGRWQYSRHHEKRSASPQRCAWTLFSGEPLDPHDIVKPTCGNRDCVRPSHILVLKKSSMAATVAELQARGMTTAAIARQFGVTWSVVGNALRGTAGGGTPSSPSRPAGGTTEHGPPEMALPGITADVVHPQQRAGDVISDGPGSAP